MSQCIKAFSIGLCPRENTAAWAFVNQAWVLPLELQKGVPQKMGISRLYPDGDQGWSAVGYLKSRNCEGTSNKHVLSTNTC